MIRSLDFSVPLERGEGLEMKLIGDHEEASIKSSRMGYRELWQTQPRAENMTHANCTGTETPAPGTCPDLVSVHIIWLPICVLGHSL